MGFALGTLLVILGIFFACIFGTVFGAVAGAIVGIFFNGTLGLLAQALGIPDAAPYQLGAMFGFVGGFLSTSVRLK